MTLEIKDPGRMRAAAEAVERSQTGLDCVPPCERVFPGMVRRNTVTLLSGDSGTGKSLVMTRRAVAVCSARPWLGLEVTLGTTIYLSAEDEPLRRKASARKARSMKTTEPQARAA